MGRLTYVCATCSEHFTRRYSATRHNFNIHNGEAEIVRLIDYIIGRVSGKFLESHPSWYRREQKRQTRSDGIYDNKLAPAVVADSVGDRLGPRNNEQQPPRTQSNKHESSHYSPVFAHTHTDDRRFGPLSQESAIKLEEINILANKHRAYLPCSPDIVVGWAVSQSIKGDDRFLNDKLFQLRTLDRTRRSSFDF